MYRTSNLRSLTEGKDIGVQKSADPQDDTRMLAEFSISVKYHHTFLIFQIKDHHT